MRKLLRRGFAVAAATLAIVACTATHPVGAADSAYKVLVFSKTAGFRHDSIPAGIQMVRDLGAANNFAVDATEDASAFTTANLAQYAAVVWLSTTGDVLDDTQQAAFESYIGSGKGYVGIHAAADTEYTWPFYGSLMGAYFNSHPAIQQANVKVEDRAFAGTATLPQTWTRTDEWYNYATNPRPGVHVLTTLDESSYSGGNMGADHPNTWCHTQGTGRAFYTGLGHTIESYAEANFRNLILGGIRYAAGRTRFDCRPEVGYTPIYNGSTTGWTQSGPGSFTNSDATLSSNGGLGLLWYNAKKYSSYSLKLDWKMQGDDNSGVYVGIPTSADPVNDAINKGYEIQIDATDTPDHTTGSIYGFKAADIAARDAALNPPGEWNTYEIVVTGATQNIQVYLNGSKINDFTSTDPNRNISTGYVGIQDHSDADHVSFRNIRVKESGSTPTDQTIQAESFSSASGVQPFTKAGADNGKTLGFVDPGDWSSYNGVNLTGVTQFKARVVSGGPGGTIQVRTGSATGPVLGTVNVPNTGSWTTFADVQTNLTGVPAGSQTLFLTYTGTGSGLFDVDDFTLVHGSSSTHVGPITGIAGKCVDVSNAGTADGTKVQLWTCVGNAAQQWTVSGQTLRALGKCLDVSGAGTANGTIVALWTCNGTGAQNWAAQADGSLVNPNSGRCLDASGASSADGTQLIIWDCHGGANQKWSLP